MKTAVIMSIGTYYCPWFPHCLVSTYNIGDLIVVVNAGFDIKSPDPKEYEVPLERVSRDISELDVKGKVMEVTDFSRLRHKYPLITQKLANQLKIERWYDTRGMGITLAGDIAFDEGASMILRMDTDQVCYRDALGLGDVKEAISLYQYEFWGDVYHLADPGPYSPYNDAPYFYPPHEDDWCIGAGSPMIKATRKPCSDFHAAHLRWANPQGLTEEEKFQHFRDRAIFRLWTNEYGQFTDDLFKRAEDEARSIMQRAGKSSEVPPPEVCVHERDTLLEYIEEVTV